MVAIERKNNRLKGILPKNFSRPKLDKRRLGEVVDIFSNIPLSDYRDKKDVLGRTYEYCLAMFAEQEGRRAGEFYTPSSIVRTLVEILESYNGRVYDQALANIDGCCLVFKKGYIYESVYYNQKNYSYFLAKAEIQPSSVEFSFEMNAHNSSLLNQIQSAKKKADAMRRYPGSFAETLVMLMEERKMTNKKLADVSLVGERTIQRLRNEEEYPTSIQSILGLCVGLKLPVPEAEMLLDKSDFKLNSMKEEGYIYKCILGACAVNSIYEINEMLEANNVKPLGSDSYA